MKPRRSSICIIWLTLGADTRKCRCMSDSAGALPNRWMYLEMKARYSSWRFVGRGKPCSWADARAFSTRAMRPSGVASTMRTVPHVNWMLISSSSSISARNTCRSFRRSVRDSEFSSFVRVVILWWRFVGCAAQCLSSTLPLWHAILRAGVTRLHPHLIKRIICVHTINGWRSLDPLLFPVDEDRHEFQLSPLLVGLLAGCKFSFGLRHYRYLMKNKPSPFDAISRGFLYCRIICGCCLPQFYIPANGTQSRR